MTAFRRHRGRTVLAALGVAAATLAAAACTADDSETAAPTTLTRTMDEAVRAGFPGIQVVIDGPKGHRTLSAGVGDLGTGAPIPEHSQVRIGSNTKTFVATVLMQLVAEGKVQLDAPVETYLPGVITGNGNDGNRITVRQLLQHTSGLPEYLIVGDPGYAPDPNSPRVEPGSEQARLVHYTPAELVRSALTLPPQFEPGAKSVYTNTNYILLGMLIERVTGRAYIDEIQTRILTPLGLRDTYSPGSRETGIRGPHPRGYHEIDGKRVDYTEMDVSWADAAGDMIATPADLNTFFKALLDGKLVPAAQLAEMKKTVPFDRMPGDDYGLALIRHTTSCGTEVWGHGGSIMGFGTRNSVAPDGTAVVVTVNQLQGTEESSTIVQQVLDAALCE
ncbi:serine hydrolase domain-containing protein [Nocardia huaxiensis]|uniref:serine hydrolase domain-containing protein n=1 Tax=Nocardia huaxiensis TaxID=2755382 RepID=UPI0023E7754E|nr:serine hydrolase domain-containing protein [Nocardia huaxiensis]